MSAIVKVCHIKVSRKFGFHRSFLKWHYISHCSGLKFYFCLTPTVIVPRVLLTFYPTHLHLIWFSSNLDMKREMLRGFSWNIFDFYSWFCAWRSDTFCTIGTVNVDFCRFRRPQLRNCHDGTLLRAQRALSMSAPAEDELCDAKGWPTTCSTKKSRFACRIEFFLHAIQTFSEDTKSW